MYFRHPELLYALFLLLIPILVHLFQLRRFRTTQFTNVKFLKKAVLQTRKSSQLKKFLILCTRLLMLTCLVLAFAQPYLPPAEGEVKETETVVYLDDSYSMQARGKSGILLKRSIQDLLESIPEDQKITLFTNEEDLQDISASSLRERLQDKEFSSQQLPWKAVELKARNYLASSTDTQKNFIAISDFQQLQDSVNSIPNVNTYLVRLAAESSANLAVDTAWISNREIDENIITARFKASGDVRKEISVGLYDEERMLARKTVLLNDDLEGYTTFSLPSGAVPYGRIEVEDNNLQFDNRLYFSINEIPPVKVVVIGDTEADFLERIYRSPEFDLSIFPENNIDYNALSQANLVILNQPEKIPFSMVTTLQQLTNEQVFLVVIPGAEVQVDDYNVLLRNLELPRLGPLNEQERLITEIGFEHPLYNSVFNEKVSNFEYPKVQSSFSLNSSTTGILKYQNGQAFLLEKDNIFLFTAGLNSKNSNFRNSPLIVPTFYNIGNLAISQDRLYNVLGNTQRISIQADLQKDGILKLSSRDNIFIPQQQTFQNKVELILEDIPAEPGHYNVLQDSTVVRTLSFNVDRSENVFTATNLAAKKGVAVHSSIPEVFSGIKSANEVGYLWKWFVIFTLLFLIIEILILKFLK